MHASQLLELLLMSLAGRGPRNTYWNRPQSSGPRGGARTAAESDSFWSLCREFEQMAPLPTLFTHFPRCYSARLGSLGVFYLDSSLYSRHRPRRIDHRDERALALSAASSDSSPCPVQVMCGRFHTESHLNHKSQGVYTKRKKKTLEKKHQSISFFLFTFPLFSSLWGPKNFTTRQLNSWSLALCLCLYIYRIHTQIYKGKHSMDGGKDDEGVVLLLRFTDRKNNTRRFPRNKTPPRDLQSDLHNRKRCPTNCSCLFLRVFWHCYVYFDRRDAWWSVSNQKKKPVLV